MRHHLVAKRKEQNLKQDEVSALLNITPRHYRQLEAGTSDGSVKIWVQLANKFGTTIDHLLKQGDERNECTTSDRKSESPAIAAAELSEVPSSELVKAAVDLQDGRADTPAGARVLELMRQTGGAALA